MANPRFLPSYETQETNRVLSSFEPGEFRTYEELRKTLGRDVREPMHSLSTARKQLSKDGIYFKLINGKGVQRLTEDEKLAELPHRRRLVRKVNRRNGTLAASIDATKLSGENAGMQLAVEQTLIALMDKSVADRSATKVRDRLADTGSGEPLPIGRTLDLFR